MEMDTRETEGYWVCPDDWVTDSIERNELISLKGATPTELPTLEDNNHGS